MTTKEKIKELKKFIDKPIIFKTSYMKEDKLGYDKFFGNHIIEQTDLWDNPILVDVNDDRWVCLEYAKENCLDTQIKITNILIQLL
jgi:hypothetical protein